MKHILIVDDDKTNLVMAKNALSDLYKVTAVTMGSQALKFLEKNTPDLILLDLNMPDMDGYMVMEEIQKKDTSCNIPIVFLTANGDAQTESFCLEKGAQDFIAKPFSTIVMRSRIGRILELEELRKNLADRLHEKIKEVSDIKSKSFQDALTGLWNRSYTEEKVDMLLQNGFDGALLMMDMDNFKAINDNYGHIAGDHILKLFADTLKKYAEDDDVVCRIGGDEFMMFVSGNKDKDILGTRATNIISDMVAHIAQCNFDTNSSVSVGIAQYPDDGNDFKSLYSAADKALYHVKQNGKNSYHFYTDQHVAEAKRASKTVDLNYIRDIMQRSDSGNGTYMLDFDNFHHIYNFIRRIVARSNRDVQTILFTLNMDDAQKENLTETERAMEMLERAVFNSLRRVDVSTRYSSRQLIVILLDANEENSICVAERILDSFNEINTGTLTFDFDIVKLESPNSQSVDK